MCFVIPTFTFAFPLLVAYQAVTLHAGLTLCSVDRGGSAAQILAQLLPASRKDSSFTRVQNRFRLPNPSTSRLSSYDVPTCARTMVHNLQQTPTP